MSKFTVTVEKIERYIREVEAENQYDAEDIALKSVNDDDEPDSIAWETYTR